MQFYLHHQFEAQQKTRSWFEISILTKKFTCHWTKKSLNFNHCNYSNFTWKFQTIEPKIQTISHLPHLYSWPSNVAGDNRRLGSIDAGIALKTKPATPLFEDECPAPGWSSWSSGAGYNERSKQLKQRRRLQRWTRSASATGDTGKRLNVVGFHSAGGEEAKQRRWRSSERQGCAMKEGKGRRWVIPQFKPNNIYFFLVKINFWFLILKIKWQNI